MIYRLFATVCKKCSVAEYKNMLILYDTNHPKQVKKYFISWSQFLGGFFTSVYIYSFSMNLTVQFV